MDFGWSSSRRNRSNAEQHNGETTLQNEEEDQRTSTSIEPADIASLSVRKLRKMLHDKGLRVVGKKEELVERLLHPERETPAQIRNGIAHSCLTADYILRVGLIWVNIGDERQNVREAASITRFKAFYGVEPRTIKDAYDSFIDLCSEDDTNLKEFMMLVEWLKKCKFLRCDIFVCNTF